MANNEKARLELANEFDFLYKNIFDAQAPDELREEYLRAHEEINDLRDLNGPELLSVRKIVLKGLNANGIEPWLRKKNPRHPLTQKMLLVSYLAESSGLLEEFHRGRTSLDGWNQFLINGLKGVYDLVTGFVAKKYYELV